MSAYGQFESGRQFSDSGQIVLFDAHSKDASDAKEYIVRVFKNTTGDPKQLEYFLSNSRAQASLTQQNRAKHWDRPIAIDFEMILLHSYCILLCSIHYLCRTYCTST